MFPRAVYPRTRKPGIGDTAAAFSSGEWGRYDAPAERPPRREQHTEGSGSRHTGPPGVGYGNYSAHPGANVASSGYGQPPGGNSPQPQVRESV